MAVILLASGGMLTLIYVYMLLSAFYRFDDPGGDDTRILTPFCGAGSEMIGALKAGWSHATGIDADPEYVEIARARLRHWTGAAAADSSPLFAEEQS